MFDCGLCCLLKFRRKPQLLQPTQIEICSRHDRKPETWDPAVLSYDPEIVHNIISHHLVTQVLNVPLHPVDEKTQHCIHTYHRDQRVVGYVDLTWCFASDDKRMQTTRFWVTATENPCYDAILGRKDAEECGLNREKIR